MAIKMNECVNDFMTLDEVAECVDGISKDTYDELWRVHESVREGRKPLGGDGSDGTTEEPIHSTDYANNIGPAWNKLSEAAQRNINEAFANNA